MPTIDLMEKLIEACDEADTAFATLNIGRDHGITPQAYKAMLAAWYKVSRALAWAKSSTFHAAKAEELRQMMKPHADADDPANAV